MASSWRGDTQVDRAWRVMQRDWQILTKGAQRLTDLDKRDEEVEEARTAPILVELLVRTSSPRHNAAYKNYHQCNRAVYIFNFFVLYGAGNIPLTTHLLLAYHIRWWHATYLSQHVCWAPLDKVLSKEVQYYYF